MPPLSPRFVPRRLSKLLGEATALTLAEVERAFREGRVRVELGGGGEVALDSLVFEQDRIWLDGERVRPRTRHEHAMLNKPRSVTSTAHDPGRKADLRRWLGEMPAGIFPVGRLDRPTTGLLLFTTDGDLSNAVLRPEHHTEKVYWLWVDGHVVDADPRLEAMIGGVDLNGRVARATQVTVQHRTADFTELRVTLEQGLNRQIRRMCYALGLKLVQLHRLQIGPIEVGDLDLGTWRSLRDAEVEALWGAVGGRELVRQRKIAALERRAQRARETGTPLPRLEAWLGSLAG